MLRSFLRSTSGNFAVTFACLLPAILGSVGLAVDVANLMNAKTHLQNAADVGVLVASREGASDSQRRVLFNRYLQANVGGNVTIASSDIEVVAGINHLGINGYVTANVDLYILHQMGVKQVSVIASTYRSTKSMEVAVVLDNTGSMGPGGVNALKSASHALVDAIEAGRAPNQEVRISLVPFVTAVNIKGEGFNPAWIDATGQSLYNGWNFIDANLRQRRREGERLSELSEGYGSNLTGSGTGGGQACGNQGGGAPAIEKRERCLAADKYPHHLYLFQQSKTAWKGCVEARPFPLNFNMDPPDQSKPDTLFVPYFAPDEPGVRMNQGGNNPGSYNNSWLEDEVTGTEEEIQRSTLKYINPPSKSVSEGGPLTIGPNRACPTPIVPLTTDFSKIRAGINSMMHWNGSGTNIAEGLAWGWRVLSPDAPYTEAGPFDPVARQKYMVLMTDGRNVSFGASNTMNRSDYGAYNFLGNGLIGGTVNQGTAEGILNGWTLDMCTQMKNQGIEVFTVVYNEMAASVHNLFRNCASKPENFYMTNNTAALEDAFSRIGRQMSRLRLTQ